MAHDVFISYSARDKPVADAVCATLESNGVRCWIAPRDVQAGIAYAESLVGGLANSRLMILVFSANSNRSPQVLREVERAVSKGLPILPFRIEDAPMSQEMEYYIASQHWLDALTPPLERHLARLCDSVKALLSRPHEGEHDTPQATGSTAAVATAGDSQSIEQNASMDSAVGVRTASGKTRLWLAAGVILAIAIAVFAFVTLRGRSASQPAEPATSGGSPGAAPAFINVNNELLSAASSGDTAAAARLLGQGAGVDTKNNQGDTPLMLATKSGKIDTVKLLIEKGANLEAKNNVGETALIAACTAGHADIAQLLVEKGAATDARDEGGATPLMYAGLGGNVAIIDLLLAKGANINAADDKGETPLMYAASAGSVDAVNLMLRKNANAAAKDHNGQTALGYATQWNRPEVVQLLEHRNR
jgi:TIR domain/Ankyrin repeats (3 copies)/Ankyrin repeats (many copies)/Ankyrin repeat